MITLLLANKNIVRAEDPGRIWYAAAIELLIESVLVSVLWAFVYG